VIHQYASMEKGLAVGPTQRKKKKKKTAKKFEKTHCVMSRDLKEEKKEQNSIQKGNKIHWRKEREGVNWSQKSRNDQNM